MSTSPAGRMFQSTPPAWGATVQRHISCGDHHVSIHAPRVGGDQNLCHLFRLLMCFNPRPPRGGRLVITPSLVPVSMFQSTPPAWGATLKLLL
jgi:hypothetical protein